MICKDCKHKECDLVFGNICTHRIQKEHEQARKEDRFYNLFGETYYICDTVKDCDYKEKV